MFVLGKVRKFFQIPLFKNISWIFFGNVAYSLFNFILSIFVARVLTVADNGILDYANSLITIATAVCGLGFASVVTKEFVEDDKKSGDCLCSCIAAQCGVALVAIVVLQIVVRISSPGETALHMVVLLQSTSTLFTALSLYVYWFRFRNKADLVAILRLVAFFITAIWRVIALCYFHSLMWYSAGLAAESLIFGLLLAYDFHKMYTGSFRFSMDTVRRILWVSYPFIFSALLSTIYGQTDRIMLKSMVGDEAVALYSAAFKLAGALSMIPNALIEGFRPEVMASKYKDEELYQKRFRQLYAVVFWFSVAYGVFVMIFAKPIVLILYGKKYLASVSCLSLVVWYSAFSYFGSINNMYMVAEQKTKWVQITTLAGAVCNVVLNYILIPYTGIMGAALASLLTQFIANFVMMWAVKDLRAGFYNMMRGMALRGIR